MHDERADTRLVDGFARALGRAGFVFEGHGCVKLRDRSQPANIA